MSNYWKGLRVCDFCQAELYGKTLIDGKTIFGPWATMCQKCYVTAGVGLGTGKGQLYEYTSGGHKKHVG